MNRYEGTLSFFADMKSKNAKMKFTTFFNHGHSTGGLMIGNYGTFSSEPTPLLKNGYKTEFASANSDPETDTLKWLFSKSNAKNLGVTDFNKDPLTIYPNPTNSIVNWSSLVDINKVVVNDLSGNTILNITKPDANSIDLSTYTNGMYFISFHQSNNAVFTKKIIKK